MAVRVETNPKPISQWWCNDLSICGQFNWPDGVSHDWPHNISEHRRNHTCTHINAYCPTDVAAAENAQHNICQKMMSSFMVVSICTDVLDYKQASILKTKGRSQTNYAICNSSIILVSSGHLNAKQRRHITIIRAWQHVLKDKFLISWCVSDDWQKTALSIHWYGNT